MDKTLFADTARFPHDTIDGETVLIDSQLGHLFLFTGLGPWLWQRMVRGATFNTVVGEVTARFGPDAAEPTRRFLESLETAKLLRSDDLPAEMADEDPSVIFPDTFVAPGIERYEDISDIITMDPIHDIDTAKGWPHRKAESE